MDRVRSTPTERLSELSRMAGRVNDRDRVEFNLRGVPGEMCSVKRRRLGLWGEQMKVKEAEARKLVMTAPV